MKERFLKWLKAAGIRAIKTVAQTAVGVIGSSVVLSEVDWLTVLSASVLAGIVSLLMNISGLPELEELPDENENEYEIEEE